MNKIISLIVPSYNMEVYIPRCIDSLGLDVMEDRDAIEVIVVNDGSKDRTSEVAHKYERRYPGIVRVIDKVNGHYGSCVNAALKVTQGIFVKLLDADDYFDTREFHAYIDELLKAQGKANLEEVDAVVSDYSIVDESGVVSSFKKYPYPTEKAFPVDEFQRALSFHILHQGIAFRRTIFDSINYKQSEGCPYTDLEWVTYPMCKVRNLYYLNRSVYRYFVGRADQSVNPANMAKGVGVIAKLMCRMLCDYETLVGNGRAGVKEYVDKVIATQVGLVYRSFLLEKNPYLKLSDVLTLTDAVSEASGSLVGMTDKVLHSHLFDFHYVREFRRARTRKTLKFALLDAYCRFRKFVG